jgi:1-acyl-sn-glycerol-3-phosphate acyltransferase
MEFFLALVVAGAVVWLGWWRSGQDWRRAIYIGFVRSYAQVWHRSWTSRGHTLLPTGPVILISNHTCSADPMFLQGLCTRVLAWLASAEHYEMHRWIRKLLDSSHSVPVKRNGCDAMALRSALLRLRDGRAVCIFPEGNLSGVAKGRLCAPKGGAAWLALKSGAAVVPAYIAGGPQTHKLLFAWTRPSCKAVRVYFGKPIDLSAFQGRPPTRKLVEDVASYLMEQVLALAPKRFSHESYSGTIDKNALPAMRG